MNFLVGCFGISGVLVLVDTLATAAVLLAAGWAVRAWRRRQPRALGVPERRESPALAEAEAKAALLRMLCDAAHELRTPLTALHGFLQLGLAGGLAELGALTTAMRTMDGEVRRMGCLVEALLTLGGLRQGTTIQRVPLDLARLCADAVDEHRRLAPDHPLEFDRGPGEYVVDGDARHLRSLIDHLLANVREHTPPGHAARVGLSHGRGELILDVIDSGPGIPPEYREQVFELFFRGDLARTRVSGCPEHGAGLGLTVVAAISAAHGGTVTVREGGWHGAWLRVVLPAAVTRLAATTDVIGAGIR